MPKVTKARIEQARDFLRQYDALTRKDCSGVEWLQLKFSCTLRQAQTLYNTIARDAEPSQPYGGARALSARQRAEVKLGADDLTALYDRHDALEAALLVLTRDPRIVAFLRAYEPKALAQAEAALGDTSGPDWWIVTLREHGDDEDSLYVVQADDEHGAMDAARAALLVDDPDIHQCASCGETPCAESCGACDYSEVYVNHVVRCGHFRPSHVGAPA